MLPDHRVLRNPFVALAPSDDGYFAYDINGSHLHRLNAAAAVMIELSDGTRTAAQLVNDVAPLTGGDATACARWIETAESEGLLQPLAPGASPPAAPSPEEFAARAATLRKEGQVLAAFTCQHYATQELADDPDQWVALAELAHIVGRREDAREAYETYVELSPGDAEVEHILISLRDEAAPSRASDACILQLYERFAEFYEHNMCEDLEYNAPALLNEALARHLAGARDLDVLELGCGTGLAAPHLRRGARHLTGIDLSPDMLERARSTGLYDALEAAEITAWLQRSSTADFDLVAACDTLIYFGDLQQVLKPAATRLRAGGSVAFTVERSEGPPFQLTDSGRYVHSEAHIREAARDAGLEVVSIAPAILRYEYGEPVHGLVTVLRKTR
jgi:predicted TPR repeat methyltransferase